ncbi:hypothetical protein B0J17DRAFT_722361 [Rhizoctonia solani]|nr:hypothetical protein B0J17DRAFT_722361 [Rhizoctonia solani]
MFKLTRTFVIAAVVSSSVLCAPVPQNTGKSISSGSADQSSPAVSVFGTTPEDPNYQTYPTGFCIVPALARDAGLSQGQDQLTVKQAIQLCPEAFTIAVSPKSSKRSLKAPNVAPPVPSLTLEPHSDAPPPACSPHAADDLPPQHEPAPSPVPQFNPHPVTARSEAQKPPKDEIPPQPSSELSPSAPQPHIARDITSQPAPEPHSSSIPLVDGPRPVVARSEGEPHPDLQAPPQSSPQPKPHPGIPHPGTPHPVNARLGPDYKAQSHAQPLPATMSRPSQLV